jgi:hypothetical protein
MLGSIFSSYAHRILLVIKARPLREFDPHRAPKTELRQIKRFRVSKSTHIHVSMRCPCLSSLVMCLHRGCRVAASQVHSVTLNWYKTPGGERASTRFQQSRFLIFSPSDVVLPPDNVKERRIDTNTSLGELLCCLYDRGSIRDTCYRGSCSSYLGILFGEQSATSIPSIIRQVS